MCVCVCAPISVGCNTVSRQPRGLPHVLDSSLQTHTEPFIPLNLWLHLFPPSCSAWIPQHLKRVRKAPWRCNAGCFPCFQLCADCLLVHCLYRCCNFVWSEVATWNSCYPFQKVVRHIFIHANMIFYIWIVDLFNELQYNTMYFYIVSSFLFKDRLFYFILAEQLSGKAHGVPQSSTQLLHTSQIDRLFFSFF